jgi:VWFA-related protein
MLKLLKPICLLLLAVTASASSISARQTAQANGSSVPDPAPASKAVPAPANTPKADADYHVFRVESLSLSEAGLDADTTSPEKVSDESSIVSSDFGKLPPSIDLSGDSVSEVSDAVTSVDGQGLDSTGSSAAEHPVSGAQTPAPRRAPLVLKVTSKVVLVDVVVTEKGNAVHDLDRSRFHILEDGHEQHLSYFDETKPPASAPAKTSTACVTQTASGIISNVPCATSLGPVNVLLLDALNTPIANQVDIQHQVLKYLSHMPPGTSLAVFMLGGHGELQMLSGFTMDAAQLEKAVRSEKAKPSLSVALDTGTAAGLRTQADRQAAQSPGQGATPTPAATNLRQAASDVDAQYSELQTQLSLAALQQLARYLEAIPGRKNLIWFSGSFPIALLPDPMAADPGLGQNQNKDVQEHGENLRTTIRLLSVARIAVYPVYALGPMSTPSLAASYSIGGNQGLHSTEINMDDERAMNQSHADEDSMRQIAEQTGGHYVNTNGLTEAMSNAIKNGASYYTLGSVPARKDQNARFRNLKVHVDGASYALAYRRGYFPDAIGAASDHSRNRTMQEATLPGAPPATQIQFQARVLPSTDPVFKSAQLSLGNGGMMAASLKGAIEHSVVDLAIDPRGLNFEVSAEGTYRQQLEFAVIAYAGDGRRVNYVDQGIQLNLKPDQYVRMLEEGTRIPHRMEIDLPPGEFTLRIVIMDPSTTRTGSVEVPVALKARQNASLP